MLCPLKRSNAMKNIAILILTFILLSTASFVAYGSTLQGKLEYFGEHGFGHAPFIAVTLHPKASQRNPQTANSGSDGTYYFNTVEPGDYVLKIWVKGFENKSINYKIHVPNKEQVNVKKIVIHSLKFKIPNKVRNKYFLGEDIMPSGTYYSIPNNASLWIAFSDKYKKLYFSNTPVILHKNGTWTTKNISDYAEDYTKINVVMITEEESKKLQKEFSKRWAKHRWPNFKDIPKDSYFILARYDIKIRKKK
jgi:hypothetical protein